VVVGALGVLMTAWSFGAPVDAKPQAAEGDSVVAVFDEVAIAWDEELVDNTSRDQHAVFDEGHTVQRVVELPPLPRNQRDAKRIIATVIVEPVLIEEEPGKFRPADPWTRLGSVSVALPSKPASPNAEHERKDQEKTRGSQGRSGDRPSDQASTQPAASRPASLNEVEIMRFITSFGGPVTFKQDVTALAPLLSGKRTLRVTISTYKNPAWKVTLTLSYASEGVGYRRPVWAKPLFNESAVTADKSKLRATIEVPQGLARPRLWIISTGHATDGTGGDEFISRTHILRVDGQEVARWRPWAECGNQLRQANPMSGRMTIDNRELWSSDIDRSGWGPGTVIEPMRIPVAELTPGRHTVQLEIVGIRPKDESGYGYWRTSAVAVADEPWPE
jgi:hypothetical protein